MRKPNKSAALLLLSGCGLSTLVLANPLLQPPGTSSLQSNINSSSLNTYRSERELLTESMIDKLKVKELDERLSVVDGATSFEDTDAFQNKSIKVRMDEMSAFLLMEAQAQGANINTFIENHSSVVSALNKSDAAQSTADHGVELANSAQVRADQAYNYAGTAFGQADTALTAAQNAQNTISTSSATNSDLQALESRLQSQINNLNVTTVTEPAAPQKQLLSINRYFECQISKKLSSRDKVKYTYGANVVKTYYEGEPVPSISEPPNCGSSPWFYVSEVKYRYN